MIDISNFVVSEITNKANIKHFNSVEELDVYLFDFFKKEMMYSESIIDIGWDKLPSGCVIKDPYKIESKRVCVLLPNKLLLDSEVLEKMNNLWCEYAPRIQEFTQKNLLNDECYLAVEKKRVSLHLDFDTYICKGMQDYIKIESLEDVSYWLSHYDAELYGYSVYDTETSIYEKAKSFQIPNLPVANQNLIDSFPRTISEEMDIVERVYTPYDEERMRMKFTYRIVDNGNCTITLKCIGCEIAVN